MKSNYFIHGLPTIETQESPRFKQVSFVLGLLSLFALVVTAWVLTNIRNEQAVVTRLVSHLEGNDLQVANELSSELGLQNCLSLLLVLNVVATAVAFSLVVRGYFSSERNLEDMKVLSPDILASMDAGVITTDMIGCIISINPRGRELIGLNTDIPVQTVRQLGPEHALLVLQRNTSIST